MKVLEVIENDEFENQEITLDHLDKAQKAACHQLYVYIMQLKKKYPEMHLPWWFTKTGLSLLELSNVVNQYVIHASLTVEEKVKLRSKFVNMLKAKQAYQAAGGDLNKV